MTVSFTHASQRHENVVKSLKAYCYSNLVTTESLTIRWMGQPRDTADVNEFIDVFLTTSDKQGFRSVSGQLGGFINDYTLQFDIYVTNGYIYNTDNFRLEAIRDIIARYFEINQLIMIQDYENSKADIFNAIVHDVIDDSPGVQLHEYHNYMYSVSIRFEEIRGV